MQSIDICLQWTEDEFLLRTLWFKNVLYVHYDVVYSFLFDFDTWLEAFVLVVVSDLLYICIILFFIWLDAVVLYKVSFG